MLETKTMELAEVLKDFGPKQQRIWDNCMLHPSITSVISALVVQVRNQNDVINELVQKNEERASVPNNGTNEVGSAKEELGDDGISVKQRIRTIEGRLLTEDCSDSDEDGSSATFKAIHENIFARLEKIESHLSDKVDMSMLDEHKRKTKLLLKRYHEKQANFSSTDESDRAEIAKMAAEVLSVASSATESISESISSDYEYMVKSLNILRSDLKFLVESLYGVNSPTAGNSASVVISPSSRKKKGTNKKSKASEDTEEVSRMLRSTIASSSSISNDSLAGYTNSLHDKMKSVLELIDRQQERTVELEEKVRSSEKMMFNQQERICAIETKSSTFGNDLDSTSQSPSNAMTPMSNSRSNGREKDEEENKILDLQLKDINSRLDAISAQVEDSNSLYKKPTTVKAFKQKLEKMEGSLNRLDSEVDTLRKDQETFRRKSALSEDKHRKATSERMKYLTTQTTKYYDMTKTIETRLEDLDKDCKLKLKQCKMDVANLKKQSSDRPGIREISSSESTSKIRSLEGAYKEIKSSLESSKKWNAKIMSDKIKKLIEQTTKHSQSIHEMSTSLSKLDIKCKESIDNLSKKAITKNQGKAFISAEVKNLREYIESRWKGIADQLKESIQITKESIKVTDDSPQVNPLDTEIAIKETYTAKYDSLLTLLKELQTEVECQSESQKDISMRLFGLEGKYDSAIQTKSEDFSLESIDKRFSLVDSQYNKLADKIEEYLTDSKIGLKTATAIEIRLEKLIDFLRDKLQPAELEKIIKQHIPDSSEEVDKKLIAFQRTVFKMANFDEICINELSSLSNRMQVLEAKGYPAGLHTSTELQEKLNSKASLAQVMSLLGDFRSQMDQALAHKLDIKIFLASASKSPFKKPM